MSAAIVAGAVIAGGATIYASEQNKKAARNSANAQKEAAASANDTQRYIFDQQREDSRVWRDAGKEAMANLSGNMEDYTRNFTMKDFQADPGYQFRMDEGLKAIDRSAAARGGLNSGATLKALTRFGQNQASQEFGAARDRFNQDRDQKFNKYASIAGVGQVANQQLGQAGQNFANATGQNMMGAANAQAASNIATTNANNQMIGNLANTGMQTWMNYQMMNK